MRTIPASLRFQCRSTAVGVILLVSALQAGCASLAPPAEPGAAYHCRVDSALRYRGAADPRIPVTRPAPAHGSCRHQ